MTGGVLAAGGRHVVRSAWRRHAVRQAPLCVVTTAIWRQAQARRLGLNRGAAAGAA